MLIREVITEHVVNLHTRAQKMRYLDTVWDLLQRSYAKLGGVKGVSSPQDLLDTPGIWKLVRRNGRIVTAMIYKDKLGRKTVVTGTDGSPEGIAGWKEIKTTDAKMQRAWAEVSGAPERIISKDPYAKKIANKFAAVLTGKEILNLNPDGFHYTRLIDGTPVEKVIYGTVYLDAEAIQHFHSLGIEFKDLAAN